MILLRLLVVRLLVLLLLLLLLLLVDPEQSLYEPLFLLEVPAELLDAELQAEAELVHVVGHDCGR